MNSLWDVPIPSVISLSPERAIAVIRAILRAECAYAKLGPTALTISDRLMTPDGGIDAEVNTSHGQIPRDCIFQSGITGFQIKSGTTFKPWTSNSIRGELLNGKGELCSEVERLIKRKGHYSIICTGHDLTPEQRNDTTALIVAILAEKGFKEYEQKVDVLGASQIAEFSERYPGTASLLTADPVQEAWTLEEWRHDAHMTNAFEESPKQTEIISHIRAGLQGEAKHIRILGEAGLGKTRIVLESLKDEAISPYVLYIQHGSQFGQTKLFRQLLKSGHAKPLILVIDELPESELSDMWRHLKPRCGHLKIVSMDHGRDETHDVEIDRINMPYLPNDTIKKIFAHRVEESPDLDRWVNICEGSPRVAQAVADNLCANPADLLKPPATIPIWTRFLHGYGNRDEASARQIDCVAQHLALFSRFGYEVPVGEEAAYIAELIRNIDPTIGWARFQEIVQDLRRRRVLQGSRTLFFVPKALHIYLWSQFWVRYGRGFDFTQTFSSMPESLHTWFMNMFRYAGEADTAHVVDDILNLKGIFSQNEVITSEKGSQFLSILAEASPASVLRLLEATIGKWTNEELLKLRTNRQQLVWTLEKIAVWPSYSVRAMQLLIRLAVNEKASNSNNSTGTLLGLFRIGPEWAATESSPDARLPAFLKLLRAQSDAERHLGLEAAAASLDTRGMWFRFVGPEHQGLKQRAKLWMPGTYGDLWQAQFVYFQILVNETTNWPSHLRPEVCNALLNAVKHQIRRPPCTELAFQVLDTLVNDDAMLPEKLISFFWHWREDKDHGKHPEITKRLQILERRYTRRDLVSRFNRYVLYVKWIEWEEECREQREKTRSRAKVLVKALARRIARSPEKFNEIRHLLTPEKSARGLCFFGEQLAQNDADRIFLPQLIEATLTAKHQTCLHGYLSELRKDNKELYIATIDGFLDSESTAWLGSHFVLSSDYDDDLFVKCLSVLGKGWISPQQISSLRYRRSIDHAPKERLETLFQQINSHQSEESMYLLVELLDSIPFNESSPVDSEFVFGVISRAVPSEESRDVMRGYHWKNVCQKLIKWDERCALLLLNVLLTKMSEVYRLSYDLDVEPLANEIVQANPSGAWRIIKAHFEEALPKWRNDILNWLKGGLGGFEEKEPRGAIADLPFQEIFEWIDENPESRADLIAHAAPRTLDDINGGKLTRELLRKYGQFDGVQSGISANFHSGEWMGPRSAYLKRKREKFRRWLAAGFDYEIAQWIESEIECLDRNIEWEEINEERSRFD
jgi:hypothetical protein